jgi:copper chaperone CopZ
VTTTTLTAPDIVCGGCANAIQNALSRMAGVASVKVEVETKRVQVTHDEATSRMDLVAALDRAGFPVQEPLA